uniref:Uncharacterized protein n=1 Tax=Amphimedon queenslandica TaxID=400682 RepID=A0A1X7T5J3_AMPQE
RNYQSSVGNPGHTKHYIDEKVRALCLRGIPNDSAVHWSPIGLVEKDHQPGKFQLIIDLSSPAGSNINDGIDDGLTSLCYLRVEDAVELIKAAGRGTLMAKAGPEGRLQAPIHCHGRWPSLGHDLRGNFPLPPLPHRFLFLPSKIQYLRTIIKGHHKAVREPGLSSVTRKGGGTIDNTDLFWYRTGFPKNKLEMRLPRRKLECLQRSLGRWLTQESATKKELQSIIGQLSDAAIVVRPGRTFLRYLLETVKIPKRQDHFVQINIECRADLHWWDIFIQSGNGVALFPGCPLLNTVTSDASGS